MFFQINFVVLKEPVVKLIFFLEVLISLLMHQGIDGEGHDIKD